MRRVTWPRGRADRSGCHHTVRASRPGLRPFALRQRRRRHKPTVKATAALPWHWPWAFCDGSPICILLNNEPPLDLHIIQPRRGPGRLSVDGPLNDEIMKIMHSGGMSKQGAAPP